MLVSAIRQHASVTGIHMSPPLWTPLPSPTPPRPSGLPQGTRLTSRGHTASSHLLSVFHVAMCMLPHPLSSSRLLLPPLSPQLRSLYLRLHCCPANRFINTTFHTHVLIHSICLYLSGLLHTIIGSTFIHLIRTDLNTLFFYSCVWIIV